jgi:hypothetical protein
LAKASSGKGSNSGCCLTLLFWISAIAISVAIL